MQRKITGTLFPAKYDEHHQIVQIIIDTEDQDEYFIENSGKGKELLSLIHREVELEGSVRENEEGKFLFRVEEYTVLSPLGEK